MKKIQLSQGQFALVDDDVFEKLNVKKWYAHWNFHTKSYYALRNARTSGGKRCSIYMHRQIVAVPPGLMVDHSNHDSLDNQKTNLRIVTNAQNTRNRRGPNRYSKTGVRGITQSPNGKKYRAQIGVSGEIKYLGLFDTPELASATYKKANRLYYGEYGGACS